MNAQRVTLAIATFLVGLSAGFFFTYQASVVLGLARVDDVTYVRTFQAINETIRNPWFGIVFFGSVPAIGLALLTNWQSVTAATRILIGASLILYLIGIAVTGAGNLPLNNELAEMVDVTPTLAQDARAAFEQSWNRFNLVRALSVSASLCGLIAASLISIAPQSTSSY
jgi:uncharacterized membrane protein